MSQKTYVSSATLRSGKRPPRGTRRYGLLTALVAVAALFGGPVARAQDFFGSHYHYPQQTGRQIYQGICQGCHMPNAKGAVGAGAYPALAHDPRLVAVSYPLAIVLNGLGAMPPWRHHLNDRQIANAINYIRTHFNNHYHDKLTAAAVHAARARLKQR